MPNIPSQRSPLGFFHSAAPAAVAAEVLRRLAEPLYVTADGTFHHGGGNAAAQPFVGLATPLPLESLGDRSFCRDLGLLFPYVGGSMAKGISSAAMVEAFAYAGMLGFYGAAGLPLVEVEANLTRLAALGARPWGVNLIHSPSEPDLEAALVELYLARGVRLIEASAFLALSLPLVRYRTAGIHRAADGSIVTPQRIIAKISREEIAARFMAPPPEKLLRELVAAGQLSSEQAELAKAIPMAQDITVEADSGGHTDNRPAIAMFPTMLALKDESQRLHGYAQPLRLGLGGGISTPAAAAAAFAMGAAWLVTGTVNQACIESGTCDEVRALLAETRQADVTMAPSGDMFEMGVNVQVVKRGTMFAMRAAKLYDLYRAHGSLDEIPTAERDKLEKSIFQKSFDQVWSDTERYFAGRDPRQNERAARDPKHKMALVFRWYLGQSPVWANRGEAGRKMDYQIWCGPAMGAFNEWSKGSFLETPARREVVTVAYNLLFGAALQQRANQLRSQGFPLADSTTLTAPLELSRIKEYLR
ncbi:MAG: 2-nitropropane dioxygenase [Desulfuromonadales bacterium GWC2_61_20]|nr:MAG: 2-nitropropane dioxygenase [Desulfuromonadales bacterium GWC2_61_20]HAD04103.1 2-nitropropane dioxygenase [Desulfuromonas sp.]